MAAGHASATLKDFQLQLPSSNLRIDKLTANYDDNYLKETLRAEGSLAESQIHPADFSFFNSVLGDYKRTLNVSANGKYNSGMVEISSLKLKTTDGNVAISANGRYYHPKEGRDVWTLNVDQLNADNATLAFISDHVTPHTRPRPALG